MAVLELLWLIDVFRTGPRAGHRQNPPLLPSSLRQGRRFVVSRESKPVLQPRWTCAYDRASLIQSIQQLCATCRAPFSAGARSRETSSLRSAEASARWTISNRNAGRLQGGMGGRLHIGIQIGTHGRASSESAERTCAASFSDVGVWLRSLRSLRASPAISGAPSIPKARL